MRMNEFLRTNLPDLFSKEINMVDEFIQALGSEGD